MRLWNAATGEAIHTFQGHTAEVYAVSASSDFKRAVSGSDDKTMILWDLEPFLLAPLPAEPVQATAEPASQPG